MINEKDQDILDFVSGYDKSKNAQEGHPKDKLEEKKEYKEPEVATKEKKDEFSSLERDFFSVDKKDKPKDDLVKENDEKSSEPKDIQEKAKIKDTKEWKKDEDIKDIKNNAFDNKDYNLDSVETNKNFPQEKDAIINKEPREKKKIIEEKKSKSVPKAKKANKSKKETKLDIKTQPQEKKEIAPENNLEIKPEAKEKKDSHLDGFIALDSSVKSIEDISINDEDLTEKREKTSQDMIRKNSKDQKISNKPTKEQQKIQKKEIKLEQEIEKRKWTTYHNNFVLAEDEKVIKDYQCMKVMNSKGPGVITVTNKRLLCSAGEMAETELENINALTYKYKSGFNMFRAFMFLLLGSAAVFCFFMAQDILLNLSELWSTKPGWFNIVLYSVGGVLGFIALIMLFTIRRKEFKIIIYIKASTPLSYSGFKGKIRNDSLMVTPGKEAKNLAHELGALLLEIKAGKFQ